jgi:hypothetical protein
MSTLNNIFNKISDKTELASHKIDLGTIEDIAFQFKDLTKTKDQYVKLDATVQKNLVPLNTAYKQILLNKDYEKKITPVLKKLETTITKQAADLGLNVKDLPAYKQLMDSYSLASEINSAMMNSIDAVRTLGK